MPRSWGGRRAQALTAYVLDRDGRVCRMLLADGTECGAVATTADHRVPISEGGAMWDPANLRAACGPCNYRGGAAITNERRRTRDAVTLPSSRDW